MKANKPQFPSYVVDGVAAEHGHKIVRLPPYHCHFNPIELIWAEVKGYVGRNNKDFTVSSIMKLTEEALSAVKAENWKKAVIHTKGVISAAWENEGILEEGIEELIISVGNSSSSSDDDDNGDGGNIVYQVSSKSVTVRGVLEQAVSRYFSQPLSCNWGDML